MNNPFYLAIFWLFGATGSLGQVLQLHSTLVAFEDTMATDHLAIDLEGDVLVVSRSSDHGGSIKIYTENTGGAMHWGLLVEWTDPRPGYGYAIDLKDQTLAIGIRGGRGPNALPGAVELRSLQLNDPISPVLMTDSLSPPSGAAGDRFGHVVRLHGDELFVGAPGREHPLGSGAVFVYSVSNGSAEFEQLLQPDPDEIGLPFMQAFGWSLSLLDQHLLIASPFSGVSASYSCGMLHRYARNGPIGMPWMPDGHWFDATIDSVYVIDPWTNGLGLAHHEVGRYDLVLLEEGLIVDRSTYYLSFPLDSMDRDEDDRFQADLDPGCKTCRVGYGEWASSTMTLLEPDLLGLDTMTMGRSLRGWSTKENLLLANVHDIFLGWQTLVLQRDPLQTTWTVVDTVPASALQMDLNGPITAPATWVARTGVVSDPNDPNGVRSFVVDLLHRPESQIVVDHSAWNFQLFNDVTGQSIHAQFPAPVAGSYELISSTGACIERSELGGASEVTISTHDLAKGSYVLSVTDRSKGRSARTFVVY
ncbi:MAG: FG-GAP repeat protein [Flavobacteriales bacterium]|nr:FG-GAP repeat protein [Flavobacteriales bacterium]